MTTTALAAPGYLSWRELPVWVLDVLKSDGDFVNLPSFTGASHHVDPFGQEEYVLHFDPAIGIVYREDADELYARRTS